MMVARGWRSGFTLLEILMVLAIVGLLAGVALPRMQKLAEGIENSNRRADLRAAIEGLGYRAYMNAAPLMMESIPSDVNAGLEGTASAVEVPEGWRLQVDAPIRYAANGVCSGGRITIADSRGVRESYVLKPPRCLLEPVIEKQ